MYWADQIAKRITKPGDRVTVASGITPSGSIHVGNLREEMTVDIVRRALEDAGVDVRYIHSWDDFDRFRKIPKNIPKQEEMGQYIGMPVSKVPDPWDCHDSYAEHLEKEFEESAEELGIGATFLRQSEKYQNCEYSEGIKLALQKRKEIMSILNKFREEPHEDYWPVEIYCEKCWKDSTEITNYDDDYTISYSCNCGNESSFDFRKVGNIKLKWRVDWPMRWAHEKVVFEPGGKDHSSPGGSYDTGKEIVKLFGWEAPDYIMYDFIGVKGMGGKMSSSGGNVLIPKELLKIYIPEVIRFFYTGTKPGKEFNIPVDDEMFKVYEDFYDAERLYFGESEESNERKREHLKRVYELSSISTPKTLPEQPVPSRLVTYAQLCPVERVMELKGLKTERSEHVIMNLLNWLGSYGQDKRITINESPADVSDKQAEALKILASELDKEWDSDSLQQRIYSLKDEVSIEPKELFRGLYTAVMSKPAGPPAGEFILMVGKERVKKILEQL